VNYDFSSFHKGCAGRTVVMGMDGLHVCCLTCGVCANLEAVSAKISTVDACKVGAVDRIPTGKQTYGISKGGVLQ